MADREKIKRILAAKIRPGKVVTSQQLELAAAEIEQLRSLDESKLEKVAATVVRDPDAFSLNAYDMSAINSELEK
jgi:hypothetical protein